MNMTDNLSSIMKMTENKKRTNVIYPKTSKTSEFTDLSDTKESIFLAGPCPRKNYRATDWRENTYEILDNLCFSGKIINPTNEFYNVDNADELTRQTEWEYEGLHRASAIVFYLARSEDFPGFTSNVEIGLYIDMPNVFVCIPEDSEKKNANRYIKILCEKKGVPVYNNIEDTLAAACRAIDRPSKTWFLSDTHFGQERTLNFSKRPFDTVREMDLKVISNWNKRIMKNDIVYHLGDFGENFNYLKGLNFKEFHFVKGNYERDKIPEIMNELKESDSIHIYDNDECTLEADGFKYIMRHEPITNKAVDKDTIVLYGHIHGRQLVKENGIDVGIDGHNYCPSSLEDINFFANAIEKGFYDEQVFSSKCK